MNTPVPPCPQCGLPIPESGLGAVCPSCLLGDLMDGTPSPGSALFSLQGHEVLRELGRGGMGIVYLARQLDPPREVALKMLLPAQGLSGEMRGRFRLEAATVAALEHPHILPVFATGEHDGLPWFTLKYAGGGSLAEHTARYAGRWREIAALVATLAEAVHFAHQRGVLHRDLKPGNILFDESGAASVTDFGLAKWIGTGAAAHGLTMDGSTMGTPHYLTPEVAREGAAAATAASDVYGLGAILYELLTGDPPFTAASTPELLRKIYEDPAPPAQRLRSDVPRDLSAVAGKCLEKEPAGRYESAAALAEDLRSWRAGRGVRARPVPPLTRLARGARRNPALAVTAVALLAALTAGAGLEMRSHFRLRTALAQSLLSQARMTASVPAQQGVRESALQLLRAADANGAASRPELAAQRRTEIARALALPDLAAPRTWLALSPSTESAESFSPDLARYLAATADGGFALFDTASGAARQAWPPSKTEQPARLRSPALRLNLAPDGEQAAVIFAGDAAAPAMLRVVALSDGRTLGEWPCDFNSREWPVWLPDGGFLFANSRTPCLRASAGGKDVRPWPDAARAADVLPRALSPGGALTAVVFRGNPALAALRVEDGLEVWRTMLRAAPGPCAWSPDGLRLTAGELVRATAPDESESLRPGFGLLLFDAATGAFLHELPGHELPVAQLCFLHGSRSLASLSSDQGLVWQAAEEGGFRLTAPAQPRVLQAAGDPPQLVWSPAPGSLCVASPTLPAGWRIWPQAAGGTVTCALAAADGSRLFLSTRDHLEIRDASTGTRLHRRPWPEEFTRQWPWMTVTPDGRNLIVGDEGQPLHVVPVADAADGRIMAESGTPVPHGPGGNFYMIHGLSATGGWAVCDAPAGRTVQRARTYAVWPDGDPARAQVVARDSSASTMHVLGNDGRWALLAARNGLDCEVHDLVRGVRTGSAGLDDAVSLTSSPDHRFAALSGGSWTGLWDAQTQQLSARWAAPGDTGGTNAIFSPDSRLLALHNRSGSIHLHEVPSGRLRQTLSIPGGFPVWTVQWTGPQRLAVIGSQGRLGQWDLADTDRAAQAAGL